MREIAETYDTDFMLSSLYECVSALTGSVDAAIEVPCSGGSGLCRLRRFCDTVTGIDLSEELVAWAVRRVKGLHRVNATVGNLTHMDGSITGDLVLVPREGLQFIAARADVGAAIASLARAVRPGGRLMLDCFDFRHATRTPLGEAPRYFCPRSDGTSSSTATLFPSSGGVLRRRTVAESISSNPIAFSSTYQLNESRVHRDFLMTQFDVSRWKSFGWDAGLVLEFIQDGYRVTSTETGGETGRRIVVFRKKDAY